jgi:hypothetical protein
MKENLINKKKEGNTGEGESQGDSFGTIPVVQYGSSDMSGVGQRGPSDMSGVGQRGPSDMSGVGQRGPSDMSGVGQRGPSNIVKEDQLDLMSTVIDILMVTSEIFRGLSLIEDCKKQLSKYNQEQIFPIMFFFVFLVNELPKMA